MSYEWERRDAQKKRSNYSVHGAYREPKEAKALVVGNQGLILSIISIKYGEWRGARAPWTPLKYATVYIGYICIPFEWLNNAKLDCISTS